MKKTLLVLIAIAFAGFLQAQNLTVRLQNQYENNLTKTEVQVNGIAYTTNDSGFVSVPMADTLTITAHKYKEKKIAVATIKDNTIEIKKEFAWKDLLNPMFYIINGGLWLLLFIVFAETGLFAGFFLPGDSLLFVAGIYSTELIKSVLPIDNEYLNLALLIAVVSFFGIIGNTVGYWFGKRIGPTMYHWKDRLLFKQKYLHQAHDFYEKHGGLAIIGARFLPIVRTFAPIIAGIVGMDKKKFAYFNIVGCIAWVSSMILAGHFLQKWIYQWFGFDLKSNLEAIVIGIIVVTTAPVLFKMFFSKKRSPVLEIGKDAVEDEATK